MGLLERICPFVLRAADDGIRASEFVVSEFPPTQQVSNCSSRLLSSSTPLLPHLISDLTSTKGLIHQMRENLNGMRRQILRGPFMTPA